MEGVKKEWEMKEETIIGGKKRKEKRKTRRKIKKKIQQTIPMKKLKTAEAKEARGQAKSLTSPHPH